MGGATVYGQFVPRALALKRFWQEGSEIDEEILGPSSSLRNEPLQAFLLAERGDKQKAASLIDSIKEFVPTEGSGLFWLSVALPLAAAQVTLQDRDAREWLPGLQRYAGGLLDWFHVDIEMGRLHTLLEDWSRAEECFRQATTHCEENELTCFLALAKYYHGTMFLLRRQPDDRRKGLAIAQEAVSLFSELGMDYPRAKAERLLPKVSGERGERRPAGLSEREWEILGLLAEGRTNQDIADVLFVSRRTVENHLQQTYRKIDVTNRTAAIAWFLGRSEPE